MNIINWPLVCSPTTIVLTTWIPTEAQFPTGVADGVVAGAVAGVVAGAVLSVIVVVVFVAAVGVVIWRYRLSTYCCVNTLSILVLQLYFTFTTQTKTERNDVVL